MRNLTSCICILGLSGVAAGDVLMDQIGANDGSGVDTANAFANQDFEAAYDQYDVACCDNFTGNGENVASVEMVMSGWNGFTSPDGITGWSVNFYTGSSAAGSDLTGDIDSQYMDAADATVNPDWTLANYWLIEMPVDMTAGVGDQLVAAIPSNEFGVNGQTACAWSNMGDGVSGGQANPGGGFGFGPWQETAADHSYRIMSGGPSDPCASPLSLPCPADIDGDGVVGVNDVLGIIGSWGDCGDGTYRPLGDIAPLPNGDCCVDVQDVLAVVGSFGADCAVYGACCYSDGSCADGSTADDCAAAGGSYLGDNSMCADGGCVAGACCISTTECADLTGDACNALGGDYEGDGTSCAAVDCAAVTAGDECSSAIAVYDGANAFDISDMTPSAGDPDELECPVLGWVGFTVQDGWYSYVATGGLTHFTTCDATSFDTSMVLYSSDCTTQVACNGDSAGGAGCQTYYSEFTYDCTAGTTYYVRMGGWQGAFGAGTLTITAPQTGSGACCMTDGSCIDEMDAADCNAFGGNFAGDGTACADDPCAAGAGDECDTALEIFEGANAFSTLAMTPSYPVPDDTLCPGEFLDWGDSPDGWYYWVSPGDGTASFSACDGASYDTSMALYTDCDTQVSCNGDTSGETGCQAYYSAIYDWPVVSGQTYIVRMGGWNGDSGNGTVTITFSGAGAIGACCLADGTCADMDSVDCAAAGGLWDSGSVCADDMCPDLWNGCDGPEYDCDDCWMDGDDSATDCNGGLNAPTPVYQAITLGTRICGTASVFVDGPTGGTYRDLDWYDNAALNAGGDFTMTAGSSGEDLLFGIVDLNAGAFVNAYVLPGGTVASVTEAGLPAGNYAILCGPSDWNVAWTCASGLVDYSIQLD